MTNTVDVGPGESRDVLVTPHAARRVPALRPQLRLPGNGGGPGWGGMMTVLRVGAAGHYRAQTQPNT